MKHKKLSMIILYLLIVPLAYAQTNSATISQSGWYRIAINGPLVEGSSGGDRAAARFILKDVTSGLHQTVEFLAYVHFGQKPSIVVLNNSYYASGTPPFSKIRIVMGSTYDGAAIDVYVNILSPYSNSDSYYLLDNDQSSGWTAVNWQLLSTTSGDQDGVPTGFTGYVMNLPNVIKGFVTNSGQQQSYYNGNFYTSGNILLGKTTQTNTSYKLYVNGNIRANQVTVNATGADYVFDPIYHIRSIDSLNNYIQAYHHLPGISTAGQMQKEGNNLGVTQIKILQNEEEMALYIISMNKTQQALEGRLSQLASANKKLRTEISELSAQIGELKSKNK